MARALENVSNNSLTTIANKKLNVILQGLYTNYQWDFLVKTTTLNFAAQTPTPNAPLPQDYRLHAFVRWRDTSVSPNLFWPLWYIEPDRYLVIRNPSYFATRPEMFSILPTWSIPTTVQADPESVATTLAIYPCFGDAGGQCDLTYYYLPNSIDDTSGGDSIIPVFPDHSFLIDYLTNELYEYLRDPRYDKMFVERTIHRVRQNFSDQGMNSRQLRLDQRIFRPWVKNFGNIFDPWR